MRTYMRIGAGLQLQAPWLGGCSALVWAHGTNTDPLRNLGFAGVGFTASATWYQVSRTIEGIRQS